MPFDKVILLRRGRSEILWTLLAKTFLDMLVNLNKYLKSSGWKLKHFVKKIIIQVEIVVTRFNGPCIAWEDRLIIFKMSVI